MHGCTSRLRACICEARAPTSKFTTHACFCTQCHRQLAAAPLHASMPCLLRHLAHKPALMCDREFVVCIMSDWYVEAANHTCGDYARGVNEWELSGLTPIPSTMVKAPRVKESAVHMECKLRHVHEITDRCGQLAACTCRRT
jgi:hypothetical protein